ncbi:MAG: replication initiation factor [Bacillota bacterium]
MIYRGIDTLEFGLDIEIDNYEELIRPFLKSFKILKEEGQIQNKAFEIEMKGINLTIEPNGMRFYAYRITCKDFMIGFAEKPLENNPVISVKFLSGYLWSYGHKKAYELFIAWFQEAFGEIISGNRISRADCCCDTDEVKFIRSEADDFVTRAQSKSKCFVVDEEHQNGRCFTGFNIGRGQPILCRIYDKTREIKKSGKAFFNQLWEEKGWDGIKAVWRTEFQLRRKVQKELKINRVEDLFDKEDELWAYMTGKWLMLKIKSGDNVSRWTEKRKWEKIRNAGIVGEVSPLVRESVKQGDIRRLLDQASGCLISIGAQSSADTFDKAFEILKGWGEIKLQREGIDYSQKVALRMAKYIKSKV